MVDNGELTLFDLTWEERSKAVENLMSGTTPKGAVYQREGRGRSKDGKPLMVDYVKGAWLERQMALVTGFRWSAEVLEERFLPDWWEAVRRIEASEKLEYSKQDVIDLMTRVIRNLPREVGAKVKVTIYDRSGNPYSQTNWGGQEVKYYSSGDKRGQPLSIFDDMKGAVTDGKKKAIVDFGGFANDIYGGREASGEV